LGVARIFWKWGSGSTTLDVNVPTTYLQKVVGKKIIFLPSRKPLNKTAGSGSVVERGGSRAVPKRSQIRKTGTGIVLSRDKFQ
jgi:hypothetical protein